MNVCGFSVEVQKYLLLKYKKDFYGLKEVEATLDKVSASSKSVHFSFVCSASADTIKSLGVTVV